MPHFPSSLPASNPHARITARPLAAFCVALASLAVIGLAGAGGRAAAAGPAEAPAQAPEGRRFAAGQVLVKFRPGTPAAEAAAVLRDHGVEQMDEIAAIGWRRLRAPVGREEETAARLSRNPNVLHAATNGILSIADTNPNDPFFVANMQWNLPKVQATLAWDVVTGSVPITIAVIDTGVDGTHPDLTAQMVDGAFQFTDFTGVHTGTIPAGTKNDPHGHGTHVAGILGASTNNATGVAGMFWGARIMPFRSQDSTGNGEDYDVAAGLVWVVDHGASVVNISLGGTAYNQALSDAAAYAWANGVVVVAAGGNYSGLTPTYPAAYTDVLGISPTGQSDQWVNFGTTGHGFWIDAAAPGQSVLSTHLYSGYVSMSGTSMASPLVAGLAALIRSANPDLTNSQVTRIITTTADKVGVYSYAGGWNEYYGHGRVNAATAILGHIDLTGPLTAAVATPFTYTLTLLGGALPEGASTVVTMSLPAGASFAGASGGGVLSGGLVSWMVGAPGPLETVERTVVVTATATVTVTQYGAARDGLPVPNGGRILVTRVGPELALSKSGPASALPGALITYTLAFTNSGVQAATGLVLTDALPAGAWFVSAGDGGAESGGVVSWAIPALQPGAGLTRTVVVTAEQTLFNSDYRLSCLEGTVASGAAAVRTAVLTRRTYGPVTASEGP